MLYKTEDPLPYLLSRPSVFLAGGVQNCEEWQTQLTDLIDTSLYDVVNPRGQNSRLEVNPREHMLWEHRALDQSDSAIFWFPKGTVCATALLELGRMLERASRHSVRLVIGWHPKYSRAVDIETLIAIETQAKDYVIHSGEGWDTLVEVVQKTWG